MVPEPGHLVCRSSVGVEKKNDFRKKMNSGFGFGRLGFGRTLRPNPRERSKDGRHRGLPRAHLPLSPPPALLRCRTGRTTQAVGREVTPPRGLRLGPQGQGRSHKAARRWRAHPRVNACASVGTYGGAVDLIPLATLWVAAVAALLRAERGRGKGMRLGFGGRAPSRCFDQPRRALSR